MRDVRSWWKAAANCYRSRVEQTPNLDAVALCEPCGQRDHRQRFTNTRCADEHRGCSGFAKRQCCAGERCPFRLRTQVLRTETEQKCAKSLIPLMRPAFDYASNMRGVQRSIGIYEHQVWPFLRMIGCRRRRRCGGKLRCSRQHERKAEYWHQHTLDRREARGWRGARKTASGRKQPRMLTPGNRLNPLPPAPISSPPC